MQAKGTYAKLLIGFEPEYGVDPSDLATKSILQPFNSLTLASTQNQIVPDTITGRRDQVEPIRGNNDTTGNMVVPVGATAFSYIIKALLGSPDTVESDISGMYKHTFKLKPNQPSLVIEKGFPDIGQYMKYNGCKISKLAMSFGGDAELIATVDIMGAKETIAKSSMATTAIEPTIDRLENFSAVVLLDGTEIADITQISLDIDTGLDGEGYAIGSMGFRNRINEGIVKPTGSITAFFEDDSYITRAENNTVNRLEITLKNNDFTMNIILPEVQFARTTPGVEGPAGIKQTFNYNAFYKSGSENSSIVVEIVNKIAAY